MRFGTVTWGGLPYWHLTVGVREATASSVLTEQNKKQSFIQYAKKIQYAKQHLMKSTRNSPPEETKA